MVPYPLKKGTQRFLAIVEKYYGPLDYDFVAEKEKLHPKPKEWWKSNGIIGNLLKTKLSSLAGSTYRR